MEKNCWQITVAAFMQPLQYDLRDPAAKDNSITNAAKAGSNLAIPFTWREGSYSCKAQWNSIGNSSTSTTCNPIYIAGTILELQITMEFCRPHMHEKQLKPHLQCGTDPNMIRDRSDQTHPPAPLATPFTMRERSDSCKSQWNSVDHTCTKNSWNTMRNRSDHDPPMIRTWSEHDPTTHETVSHPSHSRGRSSRFGDALCMEKHRVSCICYLSKTHFVRDFLQNSIGNSSTSTTCNPIYSEGTILELQIMHNAIPSATHLPAPLASHLQCGNDPTVANHNGILSTTHARKRVDTAFTMRNRSDHDPPMIRTWSDHTRDRLAPVAPQR